MSDPSGWAAPGASERPAGRGGAPPPAAGRPAGAQPAPKPGVIPLRPLGVTEILDGAVSYIRSNPVATLGVSAVVITITQLVQLLVTQLLLGGVSEVVVDLGSGRTPSVDELAGLVGSVLGGAAVTGLVTFIASTILTGLLVVVLGQAVLGRKMPLRDAWVATRGRIPGLLGLALLTSLVLVAVLVAGAVPVVVGALLGAPAGVLVALGVLGVLGAVCLAVFLGVAWSMTTPAYVFEGIPAMAAYGRSFRLVRPRWWNVFATLLLGALITVLVGALLAAPFSVVAGLLDGSGTSPTGAVVAPGLLSAVLIAVGTIIGTTITAPFGAGVTGLLYLDQRMRREAFDLQLLRAVQHPAAQHPTVQHPTVQHPTAQHPTAQHPTAQHSTAQHPGGPHPDPQFRDPRP